MPQPWSALRRGPSGTTGQLMVISSLSRSVRSSSAVALAVSALSLALLSGCATPPPADDPDAVAEYDQTNDPFEPTNRAIFDFNMAADRAVFKPVAEGYRDYVPEYARDRIHDAIDNWRGPLRFLNDIAQGDIDHAVETFIRFTFNTGFGIGGLFDLSTPSGIPNHQTDTGATFAVWGVGEGPYLMLPILGPSNPRDLAGWAVDYEFDPVDFRLAQFDGYRWVSETRGAVSGIDKREHNLDAMNEVERSALDLYSSVRSLYRQHREAEIHHTPNLDKLPSPGFSALPATNSELSQETR